MSGSILTSVLLPAAIAVIMWSLGLTLTRDDFRRVLTAPRGVAIGMLNLALLSPLLAVAMAELFELPPELAVGLVLLGASPGGMMANMLTHLSRGDTALSVTMTAVVDRLEGDGLVRRTPSESDRRTVFVSLTAEGVSAFEGLAAGHETEVDRLFAGLSETDLDQMTDILKRAAKP